MLNQLEPAGMKTLTTYFLTLDLKTEKKLQGLKLVQLVLIMKINAWCPRIVKIFFRIQRFRQLGKRNTL